MNIIAQLFQLSFLLWFETEVSISWDLFRSGASFLLTHHRPCCALPQLSQAPHLTSSLKSQGPLGDLVGPWGTPLETWRPPRCSPWWMASTSSVSLPPNVSIISEWLERTRGCSDLSSVVRNWRRRPFPIVFKTLCCAAISFDEDDRPNALSLCCWLWLRRQRGCFSMGHMCGCWFLLDGMRVGWFLLDGMCVGWFLHHLLVKTWIQTKIQ